MLIRGAWMEHIEKQIWGTLLQLQILLKKTNLLKSKSYMEGSPDRCVFYAFFYACTLLFYSGLTHLKCLFNLEFYRFLISKLKFCPTNQDLVVSAAIPTCALQLQKLVKRTERYAVLLASFSRLVRFCMFSEIGRYWLVENSLPCLCIDLCSGTSSPFRFNGRNDEEVPI